VRGIRGQLTNNADEGSRFFDTINIFMYTKRHLRFNRVFYDVILMTSLYPL
jgi:hypothetical protein